MPKPIAKWNTARDVWEHTNRMENIFCGHSDVYSETFPTSGMTRNGVAYELPTWTRHTDDSESSSSQPDETLLRTPQALEAKANITATNAERRAAGRQESLTGQVVDLAEPVRLLQTPLASEGTKPSNVMGVERRSSTGQVFLTNQIVTLCGLDPSERLLPTPTTSEATGAGRSDKKIGGENLRTAVTLLPTPNTMDMLPVREGEAMERQLRRGEGEHASRRSTMGNLREDIIQVVDPDVFKRGLLPTPTAERPDGRKSEAFSKGGANFFDIVENDKWGAYSSAIRRWEKINGEAPDPTELTPKGKHRLNAGFAEWMMGLPPGWVTGETDEMWEARIEARKSGVETNPVGMRGSLKKWVLGISRNDQLRAIGNGVVPQQAIAALTDMIQATGNGGFFDIKKGKS